MAETPLGQMLAVWSRPVRLAASGRWAEHPVPGPNRQTGVVSEFADRIDALTLDQLRRVGSLKWSAYPGAIGAWVAEADFGLAPAVAEVVADYAHRQLTGYAPRALRTEFQQATAEFVAGRYGWQLAPELVHQLPDVLAGLALTMHHWLPAGSRVIVPTPCYMPFVDMPAAFGHELVQLPMLPGPDGWRMDLAGLDRALAAGPALLVLCNPHNPIGKVYTAAELTEICELVDRHGGLVFSDEIHAPLIYPGARHQPYAALNDIAAGHTVTAFSGSKAFNLAGLKCAQLVLTNPAHQRLFTGSGHGLPYESTPIGMAATVAAYRFGGPWLADVLGYLRTNRDLLIDSLTARLPQVRGHRPQATFLAWLDVRELGLTDPCAHFLRAGVALTDGAGCGAAGRGGVRFNFALPTPLLRAAVDRMVASLP